MPTLFDSSLAAPPHLGVVQTLKTTLDLLEVSARNYLRDS